MQNETEDVLDFGDGVLVVLIASSSEKLLRQLLRPVCLVQGYDLVLPDASCHHLLRGWEWRLLRRPEHQAAGDARHDFQGPSCAAAGGCALVLRSRAGAGVTSSGDGGSGGGAGGVFRGPLPRGSCQRLVVGEVGSGDGALARFPWSARCERLPRAGCAFDRRACVRAAEDKERARLERRAAAAQAAALTAKQAAAGADAGDGEEGGGGAGCAAAAGAPRSVVNVTGGYGGYELLVPVALHDDPEFLRAAAAAVRQHNAERPDAPVTPIQLEGSARPAAAALAIQSAWRAHHARRARGVAAAALRQRAAVLIQRAWRAALLRSRLQLLSMLAASLGPARVRAALGRRAFVVDAASWRLVEAARAAGGRGARGLLPEQRLRFLFDAAGRVLLLRRQASAGTESGSDCSGGGGRAVGLLPEWVGAGELPSVDNTAAAALLEESIFFDPFGREDAWRLLEHGCQVKELEDSLDADAASRPPPPAPARLVVFPDAREALVRCVLLAALTWDCRERRCAVLQAAPSSGPSGAEAAAGVSVGEAAPGASPRAGAGRGAARAEAGACGSGGSTQRSARAGGGRSPRAHAGGAARKVPPLAPVRSTSPGSLQGPLPSGGLSPSAWPGSCGCSAPSTGRAAAAAPAAPPVGGRQAPRQQPEGRQRKQGGGKGRGPSAGLKLRLPAPGAPAVAAAGKGGAAGVAGGGPDQLAGSAVQPAVAAAGELLSSARQQQAEELHTDRRDHEAALRRAASARLAAARGRVATARAADAAGGGGSPRSANTGSSAVPAGRSPDPTGDASRQARAARAAAAAGAAEAAAAARAARAGGLAAAREAAAAAAQGAGAARRRDAGAGARLAEARAQADEAERRRRVLAAHVIHGLWRRAAGVCCDGGGAAHDPSVPDDAGAAPEAAPCFASSFARRVGALQRRQADERAAALKARALEEAVGRACELRESAAAAAAAAAERRSASMSEAGAAAARQRCDADAAAGGAAGVAELEAAARRAAAAARRMEAADALRRVGPAGGSWGSKSAAAAALKRELRATLVGAVGAAPARTGEQDA